MRKHRKNLANSRHRRHRAQRRLRPLQLNNQLFPDNQLRRRVSLPRNRREFLANRHRAEYHRAHLREHREPQRRQASPFQDPA